jgi:CheY-like chemotaxis protein
VNFAEQTPTIDGDPNQIEQIMMNLLVNARDAMPDGGLITIRSRLIDVGGDRLNIPSYVEPGRYVMLSVSDTGTGISKEVINRIFDPFFTTKERGKGTGLGLATVYGIVKDHKGYVSVQSNVGKGTTFEIYFPISGRSGQKVVKPRVTMIEGNENILIVDDDNDVLNLVSDLLETHGYHVMPVSNSLNAIDVFKTNLAKINLVITDIVMPLMEGNDLIKILKNIKPEIRILVISGYSDAAIREDGSIDAFLKKPFERMELLTMVRRILDTGRERLPLY